MIYRTIVFGHWKCSGGYRVHIGSPEGVPGTPGKRYGPYGPRGETHQPQRGWCTPQMGWPNWSRKGEGGKEKGNRIPPSPSSLPTPNRNRKGGEAELGGTQVGFLLLGVPSWLPLLPSNLYIYERGITRTHTNHY